MPARPPRVPLALPRFAAPQGGDAAPETQRALSDVAKAMDDIAPKVRVEDDSIVADLRAGVNKVRHRLGRRPIGAVVMPSVADASFAWAVLLDGSDGNDQAHREVWITTVGAAQPGATVFVF